MHDFRPLTTEIVLQATRLFADDLRSGRIRLAPEAQVLVGSGGATKGWRSAPSAVGWADELNLDDPRCAGLQASFDRLRTAIPADFPLGNKPDCARLILNRLVGAALTPDLLGRRAGPDVLAVAMKRLLASHSTRVLTVWGLWGVTVETATEISGTCLIPPTNVERSALALPSIYPDAQLYFAHCLVAAEADVPLGEEHARPKEDRRPATVARAIRLATRMTTGARGPTTCNLVFSPDLASWNYTKRAADPLPWSAPKPIPLSEAQLGDAKELVRGIETASGPLALALKRIDTAGERESAADWLIDMIIAVEALLVGVDQGELTYRMALRGARLVGAPPERVAVMRTLKRAYTERSKIVHGAREQLADGVFVEISEVIRRIVRAFCLANVRDPSVDLRERLDEALLGVPEASRFVDSLSETN